VKKVTLKGPGAKGGKPSSGVATGALGEPCTGNKYAIVIGIEDYPGTANDLQYAVDDAEDMRKVLVDNYGFQTDHIKFIKNTAATKTAIFDAIEEVENTVGAEDEVVFFFSGHGAKGRVDDGDFNKTDQSIVVNNDTQTDFEYIWDGELVQWFDSFPIKRLVFIFDSCLSGGMSVLDGSGRVVNMACSANGLSYESADWGGGHGQFTYYFVEQGMNNRYADVKPEDQQVTDEEAFDYAKANCQFQTPVIADKFTNDLLP